MMNKLISYFGTFTPGADGAVGAFQFEYLTSLGFAALVIFAGRAIVRRSHVLRKFAIPAPVISGLLFSVLIAIFKGTGILAISFDTNVSQRSAIGTLKIPSLNINMKVWEGETNTSMAKGLGHYSSTSGWNGNIGVCGHNRGAKYTIGNIKNLKDGDTITYTTVYGTRTYEVVTVSGLKTQRSNS